MSDLNVENYKKSVVRNVDKWNQEVEKLAKQLAPVNDDIDKLEANKNLGPDDKKRLEQLKKQRDAIQKQIETATMKLRANLSLVEVPPNTDEKELKKVPAWLEDVIKKGGIPLGKGVSIKPDVSFDFKAMRLKSVGITIKW
jgi:seryl-tRNA synthetase